MLTKIKLIVTAFAVALLCAFTSAQAAYAASGIALQCGDIVDPAQQKLNGPVTILVKGERIERVVEGLVSPDGYKFIDLKQKTCLPGLMDMHMHLSNLPNETKISDIFLSRSSAAKVLTSLKNAQALLNHGFTTIRVTGDFDYRFGLIDLRNAINAGEFQGPRLLVAPHGLGPTGGHSDIGDMRNDFYDLKGHVFEAGTDNAREAVRRELKGGADWIKIMVTGGMTTDHDDPTVSAFTDEEIQAIIDEAHRHNKKVAAHAHSDKGIIAAANAGVDSIEHGALMTDKAIEVLAKNGTWLVPSTYKLDYMSAEGEGADKIRESFVKKVQDAAVYADKMLKKAYKARVNMAFGTDPEFSHEITSREFGALVRRGISPRDAIAMATINAAQLLGLEHEIGSLEVGKFADIVAVPGNPLEDITIMEKVNFVMKNGAIVRQ